MTAPGVLTVTVTRSAGADGALVVFLDTYEHYDAPSRPLRIVLNDEVIFADAEGDFEEPDRPARSIEFNVKAEQIAYLEEND